MNNRTWLNLSCCYGFIFNSGNNRRSAEMMLRHMGWKEAADLILTSLEKAIGSKKVTYDFARLMDGATQVSCSGFGQVMIDQM